METEQINPLPLNFDRLRDVSGRRCERWHGPDWRDETDPWTLADWSNAMAGEAGEAANVVKKIRRIDAGLWDTQKYPGDGSTGGLTTLPSEEAKAALIEKLGSELADVVLYADLVAQKAGIDLGAAIRTKFNRVSHAQGFPERL